MPKQTWPIIETVVDEDGVKLKKTYKNGTVAYELQQPTQKYMDKYIIPRRARAAEVKAAMIHARKRSVRLNRLGDARVDDPVRIAEEDTVLGDLTSAVSVTQLGEIVSKLEWLGNKTPAQIEAHVDGVDLTDEQAVKNLLKTMGKAIWGLINVIQIMSRREL